MPLNPTLKRILAYCAAVAFFALFCWAGSWQLDRARVKDRLLADFAAAATASASPISWQQASASVAARGYVPTQLQGAFLADRNILLDNQIVDGTVGVQVYTPWLLNKDQAVLIARGFLPVAKDRRVLPNPATDTAPGILRGIMSKPPAAGLQLGAKPVDRGFPLLRTAIDSKELEAALGVRLLPFVVLMNADQPGGFDRRWAPVTMPPERHRGYALQMFSLAAAVLITTILLTWRARRARRA